MLLKCVMLVPSFNTSAVTVSETTTDTIKLHIELRNISGNRCNINMLSVVCTLFQNNVAIVSDRRIYISGRNEFIFPNLASGTSYNYQIIITEGSNVIGSYANQVETSMCVNVVSTNKINRRRVCVKLSQYSCTWYE